RLQKIIAVDLADVGDAFGDRLAHRLVQVGIETDGDEMRGVFSARIGERFPFVKNELENAAVGRLDRADRHFAIALRGVRVTGIEKATLLEDRQVERGAGAQFLEVEIATKIS